MPIRLAPIWSYDHPFDATVNGAANSFGVYGAADFIYRGFPVLLATGSATFALDPSLFASFTDHSNTCFGRNITEICASGDATNYNAEITTQNALVNRIDHYNQSWYTLTYTYTPAVPEPSTWAMMLLGLGSVGWQVRRRRAPVVRLLAA